MKKLSKMAGERVREYTYRAILYNILTLELPPGSAMSENELSAFFGVSRTPVREAISELRRLELVEVVPQIGSFVTKIDYRQIANAQFVRMSLENAVVRRACRLGISEPYLYKLRYNVYQQRKCEKSVTSRKELLALDNEFHRLLFELAEKKQVYELMQMQAVHFDRLRNLSDRILQKRTIKRNVEDHAKILWAIENQDEKTAVSLMTQHLGHYLEEKEELGSRCPEYFTESI